MAVATQERDLITHLHLPLRNYVFAMSSDMIHLPDIFKLCEHQIPAPQEFDVSILHDTDFQSMDFGILHQDFTIRLQNIYTTMYYYAGRIDLWTSSPHQHDFSNQTRHPLLEDAIKAAEDARTCMQESTEPALDAQRRYDFVEKVWTEIVDHVKNSLHPPAPVVASSGRARTETAHGIAALDAATRCLAASTGPVEVSGLLGKVLLTPGNSYGKRLLVYAAPLQVYYLEGHSLYEDSTAAFLQNDTLTAFAQGGATAEWVVPLAKAEFSFIIALLGPWWAKTPVSVLRLYALYHDHKASVHKARTSTVAAFALLAVFAEKYPILAKKLIRKALTAALTNAPKGIELKDIGEFLGLVLGTSGIMGAVEKGAEITLKLTIKVVLITTVKLAPLKVPEFAARGLVAAAKEKAAEFQRELKNATGIDVTLDEAEQMVMELIKDPKGTVEKHLKDLQDAFEDMSRSLKELQQHMSAE